MSSSSLKDEIIGWSDRISGSFLKWTFFFSHSTFFKLLSICLLSLQCFVQIWSIRWGAWWWWRRQWRQWPEVTLFNFISFRLQLTFQRWFCSHYHIKLSLIVLNIGNCIRHLSTNRTLPDNNGMWSRTENRLITTLMLLLSISIFIFHYLKIIFIHLFVSHQRDLIQHC